MLDDNPQGPEETPYRRLYRRAVRRCWRAIKALRNYCRRKRRKYGGWEQEKKIVEIGTFVGVVAYVAVTAFILVSSRDAVRQATRAATAAEEANKLAGNIFVLGQRPWIAIDPPVLPASDLEINKDGMRFSLQFMLENSGHSPALRTVVAVLATGETTSTVKLEADMCATMRLSREPKFHNPPWGEPLFPGQKRPFNAVSAMGPDDFGANQSGMPLFVVGCITYNSIFDSVPHQTGFAYEVFHANQKSYQETALFDVRKGNVPQSELIVEPSVFGVAAGAFWAN